MPPDAGAKIVKRFAINRISREYLSIELLAVEK
jgi:hypothetical protein